MPSATAVDFSILCRLLALGVRKEQIFAGFSVSPPATLAPNVDSESIDPFFNEEERLIPRQHNFEYARVTWDEGYLYKEANQSHDVECIIESSLTEATSACAQELIEILDGLSRSKQDILAKIDASGPIAIRRRIRELIVLLKGNDIWIYSTYVLRRLPERVTVAPKDEPHTCEFRLVIVLGPPGEFGEETLRVPVDNGQPYILPGLRKALAPSEK
jgi:hypothetical protein